jgi:hypothetical protein
MKRARLTVIAFIATFVFLALGVTAWAGYTTAQLTNNSYADEFPQINDAGQVVWQGWDGSDYEIYLYSGGVTSQLTNNTYDDKAPQINTSGQVIWHQRSRIFLFSSGTTTQIASNIYSNSYMEAIPQINDAGQIVWQGWDGLNSAIYLYSDGVTMKLSDNTMTSAGFPQINSSGKVVWLNGYFAYGEYQAADIYLYDSGTTIKIASDAFGGSRVEPRLNDSGQVVWQGLDRSDYDYEIYLYGESSTLQLTTYHSEWYEIDHATHDPDINDAGKVVWHGHDGKIHTYYDGTTTTINNNGWASSLQINAAGQIVWEGYGYPNSAVYLYSDGEIMQLSNNSIRSGSPQINNTDQVVWSGDNDSEIYLASPCTGGQPQLSLSKSSVYWASYADYTNGVLSVGYGIANGGSSDAYDAQIVGSVNAAGVISVNTPLAVGNISAGGSAPATVTYHVPAGVGSFSTVVYATASDACGTGYSYPGPYPGS